MQTSTVNASAIAAITGMAGGLMGAPSSSTGGQGLGSGPGVGESVEGFRQRQEQSTKRRSFSGHSKRVGGGGGERTSGNVREVHSANQAISQSRNRGVGEGAAHSDHLVKRPPSRQSSAFPVHLADVSVCDTDDAQSLGDNDGNNMDLEYNIDNDAEVDEKHNNYFLSLSCGIPHYTLHHHYPHYPH